MGQALQVYHLGVGDLGAMEIDHDHVAVNPGDRRSQFLQRRGGLDVGFRGPLGHFGPRWAATPWRGHFPVRRTRLPASHGQTDHQ